MGRLIDISGNKYGRLTVLERAKSRGRQSYWKCLCYCGNIVEARGGDLKNGSVKSCGCLRKEKARQNTYIDITGMKFNRLTAIKPVLTFRGRVYWKFICECGENFICEGKEVRTNNTKSCGCLKEENSGYKSGELHPYYNPNLSDEERNRHRLIPNYNTWVKEVYKKYNYTCQKCKAKGNVKLHAHHIYSYATHNDLRTDINNGIVLCSKCHFKFHGKYGRETNKNQLEEFLGDDSNE